MGGINNRDKKWLRKAFLLSTEFMSDKHIQEMGYTQSIARPFDTSPGAYEVINPLPQFTRYADRRVYNNMVKTFGVGRWYDETYGQYQQKIYMRAGVAKHTPMGRFFTGFYSYHASLLARTGRATGTIAYWLGRAVGLGVTIFCKPLLLTSLVLGGMRLLAKANSTKFYSFSPAMHLYWNQVTTLVNHYSVDRGIIPRKLTKADNQELESENHYSASELESFGEKLEILNKDGQVDIYRFATLAHRRKRAFMKSIEEAVDKDLDFSSMSRAYQGVLNKKAVSPNTREFKEYMEMWLRSPHGSTDFGSGDTSESESNSRQLAESQINLEEEDDAKKDTKLDGWFNLLKAELDDGSAFVCFRVNSTGEVSESFSNSTTTSGVEEKINEASSNARNTMFNFSGGNITGLLTPVVEAVKDFAGGISDSLQISGLAVLGGAALVDIPQHWESSTASLPSQSYTMSLVAPYGNVMSQLFNMYIPLFMILAFGLPRSTGTQSYTSPPLVQLFDKGKQQTRLGMIDSISVRRGTTNLPFNKEMRAMGIEVTFSVKDLSSIMHMPISEGFSFLPTKVIFSDDTAFTDYMSSLAGLDLDDQIYPMRKMKLRLTRWATNWKSWASASHMSSFLANGTPIRMIGMFYKGVDP